MKLKYFAGPLLLLLQMHCELPLTVPLPPITPGSVIHVPEDVNGRGYQTLIDLMINNHIPVGIILDAKNDGQRCEYPILIKKGDITIAKLIILLKHELPGREVIFSGGAINIAPTNASGNVASFLSLRVPHFSIPSNTHSIAGNMLWIHIQSVLSPQRGAGFASSGSTSSETISAIDSVNETVKANLNLIVAKGHGAAWIFDSSAIKTPLADSGKPYRVFDYAGARNDLRLSIACSR